MNAPQEWNQMRERSIGLGEESSRKSFYPALQQQVAQLEQARENLQTLFNAIPDAIFITTLEGQLLEVNAAMLGLFGVTRDNFRDFSSAYYAHQDIAPEAFDQKLRTHMEHLKAQGHLLLEWTACRPLDGSTFEVEGSLRLARWNDQEVVLSVVRDITERKRLEAMLHQSQKLDALGQLAGGVAHDTNNMLGVIIGYTNLLEEKLEEDAQAKEDLAQIRRASQRSADLIRQLLAFARKQVIQPRKADLNQLVEDTQRMLQRLIGENISLVWKPATVLWNIWVDPSQIDQVLANLTVNARDAIDGSGSILLETKNLTVDEIFCQSHPDAKPGEYVALSVTDTGHGMTPEIRAHIFETFFTTKESGRGTGLGLAMVYGILRQNGGFVTVYSTATTGTSFHLCFPRYQAGDAEDLATEPKAPLLGGQETLLLVEDEEILLDLGQAVLEGAGYRVIPAVSPRQAQARLAETEETIDLLVTDLVMPEMSGWELYQWISLVRPGTKALFVSGYPADTIPSMEILGSAFLQKPFSREELLRKVRAILDAVSLK